MKTRKERPASETIGWITHADIQSAAYYIRECNSADTLRHALKEERALKNRRTVCAMLERRLKKLTGGSVNLRKHPYRSVTTNQED